MSRATVDLPQPDSPTRPKVSPRAIEKLTPSTARSSARGLPSSTRLSHGGETSKVLATLTSSTSGAAGLIARSRALPGGANTRPASRRRFPAPGDRGGSDRRRRDSADERHGLRESPSGAA